MAYEVHLSQFDGPLDLLLHLIEQAEVDIRSIFVSEITTQYLSYMKEVDSLDMDTASEFLSMAATLLYIKSRSLLPKPQKEVEEEDPEEVLIRQLREYKTYKEASERLVSLRQGMQGVFTKLPEEYVLPPQEINLTDSTVDQLFGAFLDVLNRDNSDHVENVMSQEIAADAFTMRTQQRMLRSLLKKKQCITFGELFSSNAPRLELVVTFISLLDMLVRNEILLEQQEAFGPITIVANNLLADDAELEYMDEE